MMIREIIACGRSHHKNDDIDEDQMQDDEEGDS